MWKVKITLDDATFESFDFTSQNEAVEFCSVTTREGFKITKDSTCLFVPSHRIKDIKCKEVV